jgi:hypothetical protein
MSPPSILNSDRAQDRGRKYRISLDLGSDSTVAFVATPGQSRAQRIDLQFFLKSLAVAPDMLMESNGLPSHRLKSRYAVNAQFQAAEPQRTIYHPIFGYPEVLPQGHPRMHLLDFDRYIREVGGGGSLVNTATEPGRCLFKFIDDRSNPFAFKDLLPNAKLVFQSGVGLDKHFEMRFAGSPQRFKVHPVEIIKNQVCLILENFIRPHPFMRNPLNEPPEWEDCSVILTVPNTYSPFHRDVLSEAVSCSLGCEVTTITESDAIVFYYISKVQPDAGMAADDLSRMEQTYLTIDVGKGTTDLTLMSVTYRDATEGEKAARGLEPGSKRILRHVRVAERTGRASGGAKVTFILAQFFERLIDIAIRRGLSALMGVVDEERAKLNEIEGSPLRLTSASAPGILEGPSWGARLLEFERICDAYKRELDLTNNGVYMPDLDNNIDCTDLSQHLVQQLRFYLSSTNGIILTDGHCDALIHAVKCALQRPNIFKPDHAAKHIADEDARGEVTLVWNQLDHDVRAYVRENVDNVLIELAVAHSQSEDESPFEDAVDALSALMGTRTGASQRAGFRAERVRTHVILAGQASQFKPLKDRFKKVVAEAGLGKILSQDELEKGVRGPSEPPSQKPVASRGGIMTRGVGFLKALFSEDDSGLEIANDEHIAVQLSGENLKDGCARGALDWFSSNPVMENPDSIHGQLVITLAGGGHPMEVEMNALNDSLRLELGPEDLGEVYDAWYVYYLPTRGKKRESLRAQNASLIGVLDATDRIKIEIRSKDHPQSQLTISTPTGQTLQLTDAVYDAVDPKNLRAMLWPAMLFEE